jgi:hypothetical protein
VVGRNNVFPFVLELLGNLLEVSQLDPLHPQYPLLALHHFDLHIVHLELLKLRHVLNEHGHHCNIVAGEFDFDQIGKLCQLRRQRFKLVLIHIHFP